MSTWFVELTTTVLRMRGHAFSSSSASTLREGRAGFTLVELLVVIGIIAVLIAILLPVLGKARAAANRTVCLSNIRQLGIGVLMYCNDNHGYFPTCAYAADSIAYSQYPEDWIAWEANRDLNDSAIAKFVGRGQKLKDLLRCPADAVAGRKARSGISPGQGPYHYSYYMSDSIARNFKPYGQYPRGKITMWQSAWKKILLTEASESWTLQPATGYASPLSQRHGTSVFHGNVPGFPQMTYGTKDGARASTVFLDGHAEGIDADFAFDLSLYDPNAR